jgi:RNA recognition motif
LSPASSRSSSRACRGPVGLRGQRVGRALSLQAPRDRPQQNHRAPEAGPRGRGQDGAAGRGPGAQACQTLAPRSWRPLPARTADASAALAQSGVSAPDQLDHVLIAPPPRRAADETPGGPARDEKPRKKEAIQTKLFVGNLNFDTTSEQLRELLGELGEVVSVTVPTDRDSARLRVRRAVDRGADRGRHREAQRIRLGGRIVRVNKATDRPSGGPSSRPGGFGADTPSFRPRPKGSRRNLRARKCSFG